MSCDEMTRWKIHGDILVDKEWKMQQVVSLVFTASDYMDTRKQQPFRFKIVWFMCTLIKFYT